MITPARATPRHLAIALLLLSACGAPPTVDRPDLAEPPPAPPMVSATARAPDTAVSVVLDVQVADADTVQVTWTEEGHATTHASAALPVRGPTLAIPVLGLPPATRVHLEVTASRQDGATAAAAPLVVDLPALPDRFPAWQLTTAGVTSDDVVLLSLVDIQQQVSFAVLVDRAGELLWYRVGGAPSILGFDAQGWANGALTVFQTGWLGFEEVDLAHGLLRAWSVPGVLGLDGHDFDLLPNGHALAFARGVHSESTAALFDGGVADAAVEDVRVVELDPDGGVTTRWSSWPTIALDQTMPDTDLTASPIDALHPNSLVALDDGDLLVSLRHTDSLLRVDGTTGQVRWRLGGTRSDFQFVHDPENGFSHQHYARMLPNGDVLLFDNGNLHANPASRAAQYRLDETAHTATLVWEYRHTPDVFAVAAGSAERLDGGDTLVAWGLAGGVTQVDPFSQVDWELVVPGCMVYRAVALPRRDLVP